MAEKIEWVTVAQTQEIPKQGWKLVQVGHQNIAIVHLEDGFYAVENRCTHVDNPLFSEPLEEDVVVCPWHGARFCIKTGRVLEGPAYEDAVTFPIREVNNDIQIGIEIV